MISHSSLSKLLRQIKVKMLKPNDLKARRPMPMTNSLPLLRSLLFRFTQKTHNTYNSALFFLSHLKFIVDRDTVKTREFFHCCLSFLMFFSLFAVHKLVLNCLWIGVSYHCRFFATFLTSKFRSRARRTAGWLFWMMYIKKQLKRWAFMANQDVVKLNGFTQTLRHRLGNDRW